MIQSALVADPVLERLTKAIVAHVRPRRIVLFGSRARGDARPDSDYDIMVEEGQDPTDDWEREDEISDAICQDLDVQVQITVCTPSLFERRKDDVGTVEYDIARQGIVLYVDPTISDIAELRPTSRVREQPDTPPESLGNLIETADEDVWVVEILVERQDVKWSSIAFHCQQAGEKYLKAVLVKRHIRPERTHDLKVLLRQLRKAGYPTSELKAACKRLTKHAVKPRYRARLINATKGRLAVDDCRRIVDQAKRWLSQDRSADE